MLAATVVGCRSATQQCAGHEKRTDSEVTASTNRSIVMVSGSVATAAQHGQDGKAALLCASQEHEGGI
jgi:hypothetical protein